MDKQNAYKVICELVGNNSYGFVHTHSGDPNRSLPIDYGKKWIHSRCNLSHIIEIDSLPQLSITAGFEKPDIASTIDKKPPNKRIVRTNKAVASKLNFSVTNNIKANIIMPITNTISKVI